MSIRVSIVEDHEIYRTALANLLSDHDELEVHILAENGIDFLKQMQGKEIAHVILVDFEMPGMDGPETVREIRKHYGDSAKIMGLSIHKEPRLVNEMLDAGANGFISKDAKSKELFYAIRSLLEYDYYISPMISEELYERKDGSISVMQKDPLSPTELQMLRLICEQKTNKEIAEECMYQLILQTPIETDSY